MSDVQKHYFDIFDQIRSDLDSCVITEQEFNRKVLNLSYELALKGFDQDALILFLETDVGYFDKEFVEHLNLDEMFHRKCIFLYELFKYLNYIDWPVDATQKEALA